MGKKINVNHKNLVATCHRLQMKFVAHVESKLCRMSRSEIDKIPMLKISTEHFSIINFYAIVFDIPYPNDKGYVSIYYIGMIPYRFIID